MFSFHRNQRYCKFHEGLDKACDSPVICIADSSFSTDFQVRSRRLMEQYSSFSCLFLDYGIIDREATTAREIFMRVFRAGKVPRRLQFVGDCRFLKPLFYVDKRLLWNKILLFPQPGEKMVAFFTGATICEKQGLQGDLYFLKYSNFTKRKSGWSKDTVEERPKSIKFKGHLQPLPDRYTHMNDRMCIVRSWKLTHLRIVDSETCFGMARSEAF